MDASQAQVEEMYCAALEIIEPGQRVAFLEKTCAGNAPLRAKLDEMLAMQEDVDSFFGSAAPFPEGMGSALAVARKEFGGTEAEAGKQIGPYKLLERIGEGGCGVVYLAEQVAPVHRQVALKLIKLGMDTHKVIARFESERQALALMDHPNIAHVLDAGSTESGRPYFVMELVRGVKITRFSDQERLTTRQRLDLFIRVCHAIQHAHQKGVIHRDIKPSNILIMMVDGVPMPKVIDFGIAKATSGQLLGDNTVFTAQGQFVGTPAYISPEQAALSELDVDTRSDIYSLGVLLYELLTGKTPFEQDALLRSGLDEMRRTLREEDPHRPSTRLDELNADELTQTAVNRRVEPRRLKSLLTGDLDWIVMKALEKDRNRRYQTANGFAMDIQRFLNHEPVIARPPSWRYKLEKMVRRNRTTFLAATAVVLALILGFGASTWLLFREREARRQQTKLRQEAEARAKIAQAAVLLSRHRNAEADDLMDKLQIPVTEPSLEAAGVFRSLGDWNVTLGRWHTAADRFLKLLQANQVDRTDLTDDATRDLGHVAPALIVAGDLAGYRRLVQEAIARFAGTTNPIAAEQVIKTSAILPIDKVTADALAPLAKVIEDSIQPSPESRWDIYLTGWQTLSLALFEYRRGDLRQTVFWAQKCLGYPSATPTRIAMSHLLLAMAFNRLGEPERARSELIQGRQSVESKLPEKLEKISDLGSAPAGYWNDWVIAYLLLKESSADITSLP